MDLDQHTINYKILESIRKNDIQTTSILITQNHKFDPSPLHLSVLFGSIEMVQYIISTSKFDINSGDKQKNSAIHLACRSSRMDVVQLLFNEGANDMIINNEGQNCIDLAKNEEIKQYIINDRIAYIDFCYESIEHYLSSPSFENIIFILAYFIKVDDLVDATLLTRIPYKEQIKLFRNSLLDINHRHSYLGQTVLHLAAKLGNLSLIDKIVEIGGNPFTRDKDGKAPIELSTDSKVKEVLQKLGEEKVMAVKEGQAPYLEGYLLKWTNYKNGYQLRWFIIKNGILSYYLTSNSEDICRGSINLLNCSLVINSKDPHKFEIQLQDTNPIKNNKGIISYHLKAKLLPEAKNWIVAITQSIDWLKIVNSKARKGSKFINLSFAETDLRSLTIPKLGSMCEDNEIGSPLLDGEFPSSPLGTSDKEDLSDEEDLDKVISDLSSHKKDDLLDEDIVSLNVIESKFQLNENILNGLLSSTKENSIVVDRNSLNSLKKVNDELNQMVIDFLNNIRVKDKKVVNQAVKWMNILKDKNDLWVDTLHNMAKEHNDVIIKFKDQEVKNFEDGQNEPVFETDSSDEFFELDDHESIPEEKEVLKQFSLPGYPEQFRVGFSEKITKPPSFSLWKLVKDAIGKDLTKMPLPVYFNEPLSMLQKNCEELEYLDLLDYASLQNSSLEKTIWVAAFALSSYASTLGRTSKPFNPLLGETFEFSNPSKGYWFFAEQVSHHPPISASVTHSENFKLLIELSVDSKFWGKSLEVYPIGLTHLYLNSLNSNKVEHYSWKKVTTVVNGIILGNLSIDHYGDLIVTNHNTGDEATITFNKPGWLGSDIHKLTGFVKNKNGDIEWEFEGKWDSHLSIKRPQNYSVKGKVDGDEEFSKNFKVVRYKHLKPSVKMTTFLNQPESVEQQTIWKANSYLKLTGAEKEDARPFGLTPFSLMLNELPKSLVPYLPPSDARLRPDQRAMELMQYDDASRLKQVLEERQRKRRAEIPNMKPRWFCLKPEEDTGTKIWDFDEYGYLKLRSEASKKLLEANDNIDSKLRVKSWPDSIDLFELD